jgi:hypothetical protein
MRIKLPSGAVKRFTGRKRSSVEARNSRPASGVSPASNPSLSVTRSIRTRFAEGSQKKAVSRNSGGNWSPR